MSETQMEIVGPNWLKQAVQTVKTVDPSEVKNLNRLINEGKHFVTTLLPIEMDAKDKALAKIKELEVEVGVLMASLKFGSDYKLLSLEPLKWRNEQGYPRLIPFSVTHPIFEFSYRHSYDRLDREKKYNIKLPDEIAKQYTDVLTKIQQIGEKNSKDVNLRTKFTGVIPLDVKKDITRAQIDFGENNVFLIAEVSQWDLELITPIPVGDPLVVGWDGKRLWLIREFDTTPVEQAMMDHFESFINL